MLKFNDDKGCKRNVYGQRCGGKYIRRRRNFPYGKESNSRITFECKKCSGQVNKDDVDFVGDKKRKHRK
jgi:hypothetical protein